ncbi:class II fructose-bisphosphate aldolase [Mycoplasmopsis cynos]|uniref:class II fructose-bisphosphate aldolase n=1 Tax=Mycoplasmopsis cynos TaxID=171284 RepID=UPI002540D522|nr:class II fructose-bisphosphate aldolase [Mycoplasmopsis cynos]
MALVNAKEMLKKAKQEKYAIPHININNLEWAKAILLTAEAEKSPIIIAQVKEQLNIWVVLKL